LVDTGDLLNEVRRLYAQWLAMPFPDRLRSADVADVCMVLLNADVAGCVHVWLSNGGVLDDMRWQCLDRRLDDLDWVMPLLSREQDLSYFSACREIALLVRERKKSSR
jgi:hypothetical protein